MKKLFISQPMKGKTDEEILAERRKAIRSAERQRLCRHRLFQEILEIYRMKAPSWIFRKVSREKSLSFPQHLMPAVCIFIRNITSTQMKTRTPKASGTRTGSREEKKLTIVQMHLNGSTGG